MPILKEKIKQEVDAGRVVGPFDNPPLGLIPKKTLGDFRIIQHLSYPEGGIFICRSLRIRQLFSRSSQIPASG